MPASPNPGDWLKISDASGAMMATLGRNGSPIEGDNATDFELNSSNASSFEVVYIDATIGWVLIGAN